MCKLFSLRRVEGNWASTLFSYNKRKYLSITWIHTDDEILLDRSFFSPPVFLSQNLSCLFLGEVPNHDFFLFFIVLHPDAVLIYVLVLTMSQRVFNSLLVHHMFIDYSYKVPVFVCPFHCFHFRSSPSSEEEEKKGKKRKKKKKRIKKQRHLSHSSNSFLQTIFMRFQRFPASPPP